MLCCVLVVDMYNNKVVDARSDVTVDTVVTTENEATSTPMIEDITKDDNFVDVSLLVLLRFVCLCCLQVRSKTL